MKKDEMLAKLTEATGLTKIDVNAVLNALSNELVEIIANNDSFKIGDVVTIKGVDKPARTYRNPMDGTTFEKPATSGNPKAVFSKKVKP